MASLPLAHEKWFVDDPGAFDADWDFALGGPSLALIAAVAVVALVWHLVGGRLPRPELPFLEPLGRLAPWIPRLLGIHLGVSLLSLAVQDAYLAPSLSLDDVPGGAAIAFVEGLLGVWFVTGAWLRPAGLVTLLLGPLAALLAGAIELLFGLLLISGRLPQVAVIVAGIPFNATLFFLGRTELIGHLPVYGVMLALLVYGSSRKYAEVVPAWPRPSRRALTERATARA